MTTPRSCSRRAGNRRSRISGSYRSRVKRRTDSIDCRGVAQAAPFSLCYDSGRNGFRPPRILDGARLVPGLLPGEKDLAAEAPLALKDKERIEIDQGLFLAHLLANATTGRHLCHAMLRPRTDSLELLPRLVKAGSIDLGRAVV